MTLINFKNLKARKKIILIFITFIFIIVLLSYFVMLPSINSIKELRAETIAQRLDLEKKVTRERNMGKLNEKIKTIEPQMEKFKQIFISLDRKLEFITTMEGLASNNNVAQQIDFNFESEDNNSDTYKKVPLHLTVQGDFSNIMKYLTELESINYYINILALTINSSQPSISREQTPTSNISLNISAVTYWQ